MQVPFWQRAYLSRLHRLGATDASTFEYARNRGAETLTVTVHLLQRRPGWLFLSVSGLLDDDGGFWVPERPDLPDWLPTGVILHAQMLAQVETVEQLKETPWAFRSFEFTPRPDLPGKDLAAYLTMPTLSCVPEGTIKLDWREARLKIAEGDHLYVFTVQRDTWEARICLPDELQLGEESYPLLMAFEHHSGIVTEARVQIEWVNQTKLFWGSQYFEPERPEWFYKIVLFGNPFDGNGSSTRPHELVLVQLVSGQTPHDNQARFLKNQEFRMRFLRVQP